MNKLVAKIIAASVSLSAWAFLPNIINTRVNADVDTIFLISACFTGFVALIITGYLESKREKPNIGMIFGIALLNFIGLGIAIYALLIGNKGTSE